MNLFKKSSILIFLAVAIFILSSCSLFTDNGFYGAQEKITDKVMQRICNGIADKNLEAVKAEFRKEDISKIEDFDLTIQKLFDYIKGDNIKYSFVGTGWEGKSMGYAVDNSRTFNGCNYGITTSTDSYKVSFTYWAYYADVNKKIIKDKIGIESFDIINIKNDRESNNYHYSGDPERKPGIKFDYRQLYSIDEVGFEKAYYDAGEQFAPIIMNSVSELNGFYLDNKGIYSLESREDNKGFLDIAAKYNDSFFYTKSLYIVGIFNEDAGYRHVPQSLFIGDFVLAYIASVSLEYDYNEEVSPEYFVNGVIVIIELPEKISSDIETKIEHSIFN